MINFIHYLTHRPGQGWDPIPEQYAADFAETQWSNFDHGLLGRVLKELGGVKNKSVIDFGAGSGHWSAAFEKAGGFVTWYDISANHREAARKRCVAAGASNIVYELGYLEEVDRLGKQFDFVFCCGCWNYSINDRRFARIVFDLVKPGGAAFIDTPTSGYRIDTMSIAERLRTRMNDLTGWKVGHPFPDHGLVAREMNKLPVRAMTVDYSLSHNDRLFFWKDHEVGAVRSK